LIVFSLSSIDTGSLTASERGIVAELLIRALREGWDRPTTLMRPALSLIFQDGAFDEIRASFPKDALRFSESTRTAKLSKSAIRLLHSNALLQCLLELTPIADPVLESVLTHIRVTLLQEVSQTEILADEFEGLPFYCAIARQCFLNEYIYNVSSDELMQIELLRKKVASVTETDGEISPVTLIALASYIPLWRVPMPERLLQRKWPDQVAAVLEEAVRKPLFEHVLRSVLPKLTAIDDHVSIQVQEQYEENPYPRWVKSLPVGETLTLDARVRRQFPLAPVGKGRNTQAVDILIAGCGTGRQSVECAIDFPKAKILAVDLSLTSLAYAHRMTNEARITNITYAQADLLRLGGLERRFDLVEAAGVLHHLNEPLEGWRVLISLLRPGGFMRVGLYSELARQDVVAGRAFIAQQQFSSTADGIRQCRREMLAWTGDAPWKSLLLSEDFYSTSSCRDLIFHVQEHRFTIPQIANFLADTGLLFVGFDMNPRILAAYLTLNPEDVSGRNLDSWHKFEEANPNTFKGMYQFLVQKQ
jgi:SAM-dependent methyltransferase